PVLDHEHRGVLVDRLGDGGHDAHVPERLDDLGRLHGHLLRQLRHRDGLADADLAHHRCGRHLESVPALGGRRNGARLGAAFLLIARADVAGDVQLLAAVAGLLVVGRGRRSGGGGGDALARDRWGRGTRLRALPVALAPLVLLALARASRLVLAGALLGGAAGIFGGAAAPLLLLLDPAAVLGLEPLALAPLGLGALALRARGLLGLVSPVIDLVLLRARLFFQHVALDVGTFAAHFHVHGAGAALGARQLQLALGLAFERDAARRAVAVRLAPVAAAQVR